MTTTTTPTFGVGTTGTSFMPQTTTQFRPVTPTFGVGSSAVRPAFGLSSNVSTTPMFSTAPAFQGFQPTALGGGTMQQQQALQLQMQQNNIAAFVMQQMVIPESIVQASIGPNIEAREQA